MKYDEYVVTDSEEKENPAPDEPGGAGVDEDAVWEGVENALLKMYLEGLCTAKMLQEGTIGEKTLHRYLDNWVENTLKSGLEGSLSRDYTMRRIDGYIEVLTSEREESSFRATVGSSGSGRTTAQLLSGSTITEDPEADSSSPLKDTRKPASPPGSWIPFRSRPRTSFSSASRLCSCRVSKA